MSTCHSASGVTSPRTGSPWAAGPLSYAAGDGDADDTSARVAGELSARKDGW